MVQSDAQFVGQLTRSQIYCDYVRAFNLAMELPLTLRPPASWALAQRKRPNENPFCALLAQNSKTCAACLEVQEKIANGHSPGTVSATCFAGLCDTAVPVRVGQKLVGFLQTGQVALNAPTKERFRRISKKLIEWGSQVDLRRLEDAYFHSRVLSAKQYAGMVRLLEIFAAHLGVLGNQLLIQEANSESPFSRRVKAYVAEHQGEPITLAQVSRALHVSTFYFCKMFKKATHLTFTDYLGRTRIEQAKTLLLDPNRRVSEVAYEVGFGSLTHFNRLFRKFTGESPSDFRAHVPHPDCLNRRGAEVRDGPPVASAD